VRRVCEEIPITASTVFEEIAVARQVQSVILHMRDATPGFPVALRNTHPFTAGELAFVRIELGTAAVHFEDVGSSSRCLIS
jgi:predicted glutamine amidotransferase